LCILPVVGNNTFYSRDFVAKGSRVLHFLSPKGSSSVANGHVFYVAAAPLAVVVPVVYAGSTIVITILIDKIIKAHTVIM
jgi:hypothetical protein